MTADAATLADDVERHIRNLEAWQWEGAPDVDPLPILGRALDFIRSHSAVPAEEVMEVVNRLRADADLHEAWDRYELSRTPAPAPLVEGRTAELERQAATLLLRISPHEVRDGALAAEFDALAEKATQGEVYSDGIPNDGAYGSGPDAVHGFTSYGVFTKGGKAIVDTLNSDVGEVHVEHDEDGTSAWDEIGHNNAAFIAWCFNHRTEISQALKSTPPAGDGK